MNGSNNILIETSETNKIIAVAGPGLVDIQVNGYAGMDFNLPPEQLSLEDVKKACLKMQSRGVVKILPTINTDTIENMITHTRWVSTLRQQDELLSCMIAGFHIEGPFVSPEDGPRGAHPREHVITPADAPHLLDDLQESSGGLVRLLTLAPELDGALELIEKATKDGIIVALGHLNADPQILDEAVAAGAKLSTHLGNGSHAMLPRLDNYVQRQLADDRLAASFIADGHHIPFPTLKNFIRAKTPQRSILITDAIVAADMPVGYTYGVGSRRRRVDPDGAVRLPGTPYLAGSALTLDKAVMNTARYCDVSFETAWAMASIIPAELLNLPTPNRIKVDISEGSFKVRG